MANIEASAAPVRPDEEPIQFREYKILLKAERFPAEDAFHEFWKLVHRTAKALNIDTQKLEHSHESRIREVLFFDTPNYGLYNNNFMLRKRTLYHHGWLEKEHRVALKFRHPSRPAATALNVHPGMPLAHRIRFKEELLLDPSRLGAMRSIFSHACVLDSPALSWVQPFSFLSVVFPVLKSLPIGPDEPVDVVNGLAIEEVFEDIGQIFFTNKIMGNATVAIWRNRATQAPLIGEFAFQIEFERLENFSGKARAASEEFYKAIQLEAQDWIHHSNTKTALIYRAGNVAVTNNE